MQPYNRESTGRWSKLHQILSAPHRDMYVAAVTALWDLYIDKRWILKKEFLDVLSSKYESMHYSEDFFLPDRYLDEESAPSDSAPSIDARSAAVYAFNRLLAKGWFEVMRESVDNVSQITLRVPRESALLAEFVTKTEVRASRDETACLFPAYAALKQADEDFDKAKSIDFDVGGLRAEVSRKLYQALATARDRAEVLIRRIKAAEHEYKFLSSRIAACNDPETLLPLLQEDYRKNQFSSIMQPLRVEDGVDKYSNRVVLIVDHWMEDRSTADLLAEAILAMNIASMPNRAAFEADSLLDDVRYQYAYRIRRAWNDLEDLDRALSEQLARKYRSLASVSDSREVDFARILSLLSDSNPAVAETACSCLSDVMKLPPPQPIAAESLTIPPAPKIDAPKKKVVAIKPGEPRRIFRKDLFKRTVLDEANDRISGLISDNGGFASNEMLPLESRVDRIFQIITLSAASRPQSRYRINSITEDVRIRKNGQSVPLITYSPSDDSDNGGSRQ